MAVATATRTTIASEAFWSQSHIQTSQSKQSRETTIQEIDEELNQDCIGQFSFLNGYSHVLYGFQIPADVERDDVIVALRRAVQVLTEKIPWLGGQIKKVDGVYQPAPWPKEGRKNQMLLIKECDDLMPSFAEILRAGAPSSMLDGKILTPWPSLPAAHDLEPPLPVFAMQANFVRGGLLFNIVPHHIAMDGAGFMQVLKLLSTVLSGHEISATDIEQATRDRRTVVPLIPGSEPVKDYSHIRRPPGWMPLAPKSTPAWCVFKVPLSSLPALRKAAASASMLVSDNDILCAFCWQRISAVRIARGVDPNKVVKFTRAIDGRTALGVPSSYIGHLIHHSFANLTLQQVASLPLSLVAQTLRRALNAANTTWALRSYATFISREPDKTKLVFGGLRDVNYDLGATSVVASAGDEASSAVPDTYGVLGRALFTRRPNVTPITGTITITPAEGGAMPVTLCLPEIDLEALKDDAEWKRYTKYVG